MIFFACHFANYLSHFRNSQITRVFWHRNWTEEDWGRSLVEILGKPGAFLWSSREQWLFGTDQSDL